MTIPDYQSLMLPLLQAIADEQPHRLADLIEQLADQCELSQRERSELLPSGKGLLFANRVGWARTYLGKAGLLENPARGYVRLTERGTSLLAEQPNSVDNHLLMRYAEFVAFRDRTEHDRSTTGTATGAADSTQSDTPEEAIGRAYRQLQAALVDDLLSRIKSVSPAFFERLVVDVLLAMGYGGPINDAGQVLGQSGDGGVDGVIKKEDKLGLEMIYVQAKRWENTVGRPVVQAFAGSLQGYRASKGVLITTSTFSTEARDYIERIATRIVLVDGPTLARLMIDHNVGVAISNSYSIKRMDSDYFTEP